MASFRVDIVRINRVVVWMLVSSLFRVVRLVFWPSSMWYPSPPIFLTCGICVPSCAWRSMQEALSAASLLREPGGVSISSSDFCGEHLSPVSASPASTLFIARCSDSSMCPLVPPVIHMLISAAYIESLTAGIWIRRSATGMRTRLKRNVEMTDPCGVTGLPLLRSPSCVLPICIFAVLSVRKARI